MYNLKLTIYSTISVVALAFFNLLPALAENPRIISTPARNPNQSTFTPLIIRGSTTLNRELFQLAQEAIHQIDYDEIAGRPRRIAEESSNRYTVRVDLQGQTRNGAANIQVQTGGNTLAGVLVPSQYLNYSNEHSRNQVTNATRRALEKSLYSGAGNGGTKDPKMYQLEGESSNEPREEL